MRFHAAREHSRSFGRRAFLAAAVVVACSPLSAFAAESIDLTSSVVPGETAKVSVVLEVAGLLKFKNQDETKSLPTAVTARFNYDEKRLPTAEGLAAARVYRTAEAKVEINKQVSENRLRPEHAVVVVRSTDAQPEMLCPTDRLTADELDLVQVPANSLLLEQLLPGRELVIGETWKHSDDLLCGLLNLDAVSLSDVQSELAEIRPDAARIEMKGTVQGAVGGVATELTLTGRYKFDPERRRITWFALLLKEVRSIGHVEPGVEMQARLQMLLEPTSEVRELAGVTESTLESLAAPEALNIRYESLGGRYSFEHERRWHVMTDRDGVLSMRLVDRGELVAQCNVTAVPTADPAKKPTLTQFQADVSKSLGKNFRQFTKAGESQNSIGHNVLRAEAVGTVEGLDITWIYYLVQSPDGRQVVFAFTCEQPMLERMAAADEAIIHSLRFTEPTQTAAQPTLAPQR